LDSKTEFNGVGGLRTYIRIVELVEPKEAPVKKPDKDMFDPKNFLAKVGTGKQVLEFHKNQHVFEQSRDGSILRGMTESKGEF
jgi:hypothetical protein